MKKIILSALFLVASFSVNAEQAKLANTCWKYATESMASEVEEYGTMSSEEFDEGFDFYYDTCKEIGIESMGDPVFIIDQQK